MLTLIHRRVAAAQEGKNQERTTGCFQASDCRINDYISQIQEG
jgi:hypothetical protein